MWRDNVELNVVSANSNLIRCSIETHFNLPRWELLCVYGPPAHQNRKGFWERMSNLIASIETAWCMIGDLNVLISSHEKHGGSQNSDISCSEFRNLLQDRDVIDLGFAGPAFTWSRRTIHSAPVYERLDRAMCNSLQKLQFTEAAVLHLPRIYSDHAQILLNTLRKPPKRRQQFKVEYFWTGHPGFLEETKKSWDNGNGDTIRKLQTLSKHLTKWSKSTFGHVTRELEAERQNLLDIQSEAHLYDIREEERIVQDKIKILI